ncbi:MAG: hypothetical protein IH621_16655 [Krumholzibacteria bacterium]|nr:hypothetical protein [Candidatus Krumholzibacteria bacterium]
MTGDSLTATLPSPPDAAAPGAAVLLAVDRLLTAGALYPMGHGRFAAAVAEFREAAAAAGSARSVELAADSDAIAVMGTRLAGGQRGLERLVGLFDKLGIASVRIDTDAPVDVLHTLATRLLRQRREADADGHLRQTAFDDLPGQVAVVPRTFRRHWNEGIDGRFLPILETILDEVEAACPGRESGLAARRTLERMFRVFLARGERDGDAAHCAPEDHAFFESMVRSGPQALVRALGSIVERDGGLACLEELFDDSHEALAAAAAQRALQLLLDAMAGPDPTRDAASPVAEERRVDDDAGYKIPLVELQATLDGIARDCPPAGVPVVGDLREEIDILLAILGLGAAPTVARQALAGLWHAVSRVRSAAEREFVRQKAMSLMGSADTELLDQILPRLAGPFRERGADEVAEYWHGLAAGDAERAALVWPHVVTELLRTEPEKALRGLSLLQSLAAHLPPARMLKEAARFESLPSFRVAVFNKTLFYRPRPVLYPMVAALLRTSLGDTFGQWLHEGWSRQPADTAGGLVTRATGPYRRDLRDLYAAVLAHAHAGDGDGPPRILLDAVHQALDHLGRSDRGQGWIPVAVLVLGEWSPASSRRLLERIRRERRLLVLPAWPKPCRLAAKAALALDPQGKGHHGH